MIRLPALLRRARGFSDPMNFSNPLEFDSSTKIRTIQRFLFYFSDYFRKFCFFLHKEKIASAQ